MKRILVGFITLCLCAWAVAGETWKRDTYESGESLYYSHNTLGVVTAAQLLVGENGVALSYFTGYEVAFSNKLCLISIDNQPDEKCDVSIGRRVVLKNSRELANRIANAKTARFKLKMCKPAGFCDFAIDGGSTEEISWEWDEPLSAKFPDFKPYELKK